MDVPMRGASRPTRFRRSSAWAVLVACTIVSTTAAAYVRTLSPDHTSHLLWPDAHITMTLRTAGAQIVSQEDFLAAATRASAAWSTPNVDTAVAFTIDASSDAAPGTRADHVNTISFRGDSWNEPMYPEGVLALTTVWSQGARIVDADTEINAVDPRFKWGLLPDDPAVAAMASEVDLQNALTHELGHVIGLDHPCFLGGAPNPPAFDDLGQPVPSCSDPALPPAVKDTTMYPSSETGSIRERSLSPDEVAALHDLYPALAPPSVTGPTLGGRSGGCSVGGSDNGAWGAILMIAAALAHARRRR
jgi:MYXO-CTERM domain-containing protein